MSNKETNATSSQPPATPAPGARVALVTGAAKRIGRHIALAMAARGWDIAVHYGRSAAEAESLIAEIRAMGRRAVALSCDLLDEEATRRLLPRAVAALGQVQCVVNNASLFEEDDAQSFSQAGMDRHMRANLAAPVMLAQALHAATPAGQQACVINLLDQKLYNLNPDFLSYTLSKAALQCATTTLAQALAPTVRVVGIAPGITMVSGEQSAADFATAHQVTPLGRSSTPEDIANTVCFVAESGAITGTTLLVDGGQHLIPLQRDVMFLATAKTPPAL
ncbi:SDR family oxidoreductase [Undibacterium terreum]|uniref:Short chain dehydrogenase n=1 Tax=Undibacterium terreum TaxID=1224302 RepID=A0A916UZY9_9BURK|nr:SDR family oxidoreductase [Undibacterium terreum]GGC98309.1 short chain dehydrogenase [Undibacterium terreum]